MLLISEGDTNCCQGPRFLSTLCYPPDRIHDLGLNFDVDFDMVHIIFWPFLTGIYGDILSCILPGITDGNVIAYGDLSLHA